MNMDQEPTSGQDQDDDKQMERIQEEKAALTRQMLGLIFLSLLVSGAFYGLTIL